MLPQGGSFVTPPFGAIPHFRLQIQFSIVLSQGGSFVGGNYSLLAEMSIFHCASPMGAHSLGHRWGQLLTSDHFIFRELLCQHFMFLMGSGGHSITKWRYINVKILVPIKQKLGFHPWPEAKQLYIHTWLKAKQSYVECLSLKIFIKREKLKSCHFCFQDDISKLLSMRIARL